MDNATSNHASAPPAGALAWMVAIGIVAAGATACAVAALWLLSMVPVLGAPAGILLGWAGTLLHWCLSAISWAVVLVIKLAVTMAGVGLVARVIRQKTLRVACIALFAVWLWTDWLDGTASRSHRNEAEFARRWQEMTLWNDWHSEYFRR